MIDYFNYGIGYSDDGSGDGVYYDSVVYYGSDGAGYGNGTGYGYGDGPRVYSNGTGHDEYGDVCDDSGYGDDDYYCSGYEDGSGDS